MKRVISEWHECLGKGGLRVNTGKTETPVVTRGEREQMVILDTNESGIQTHR